MSFLQMTHEPSSALLSQTAGAEYKLLLPLMCTGLLTATELVPILAKHDVYF